MILKKKVASLLAVTVMTSTFMNIPVKEVMAATNGSVEVSKDNNKVTIGNEYIEKEFSISDNKVSTLNLNNKRAGKEFKTDEKTEEFVIGLFSEKATKWSILGTSSEETKSENGAAANAIDGDVSTIWHTKYNGGEDKYPHYLAVDLAEEKTLEGFSYTPRSSGPNGNVKDYEFYVSNDPENFGEPVKVGTFKYNGVQKIDVRFDTEVTGRYIKLVAKNAVNGANFAGCAELDILEVGAVEVKNEIKTSDLTLTDVIVEDSAEGNGKKVKFDFAPFNYDGDQWDIDMNVVMEDGDHFMRKYLEIDVDNPDVVIDYIDLEHLTLNDTVEQQWSRPDMAGAFISGYQMALGQPIYLNGMFLGAELPVTDNRIIEKNGEELAQIKYFLGRPFEDLEKTTDGKFVTWQTVLGAARSTDQSVIQSDFFEYIKEISTRTDFRKQYNSWYDHMMNITAENIEGSFYEIEKGLTQSGVEPVDSYVVDDGWNDYDADFWGFNNKFPNELYDSTALTDKFSSNFGLWLGPRGGYNYYGKFARQMQAAGKGGYNPASGDICVGHPEYVKNITDLFLDYMNRFDVNYWKIDGNLLSPCPDKNHGHATGGPNGMYMVTETWESWVGIFDKMREFNPDVFINLTCYTNPSPWFLQWVNVVWLQNSNDVGFSGGAVDGSMMDAMMTYRDDKYFDFYQTRELQFPAANIYNHDPIYGNTNTSGGKTVTMNTEQFEKYLYMLMTRGTSFWELYYSYNLMDNEKWMINSEVLKWGEENFNILRNAKLIGETPTSGNVYGYSSWENDKGIISLRNPSNTNKTFTVTLDRLIGVGEDSKDLSKTTIYPYGVLEEDRTYSYGDTITVELEPHEVLIWQFGEADTISAEVANVKTIDANKVSVEFNERVLGNKENYSIEGNTVLNATVLIDHKTVELELENSLEVNEDYTLNINGVSDLAENITNKNLTFNYYNEDKIVEVNGKEDLKNAEELVEGAGPAHNIKSLVLDGKGYEVNSNNSVSGTEDFGVSMLVKTTDTNATLLSQGDEYSLRINNDGKLEFTSKGVVVTSDAVINNNAWNNVTALREKNGMIKLYINGLLEASTYEEAKNEEVISKSSITVGDNEFTGLLSNVVVRNKALAFDEVKLDAELIPTGEFTIKPYVTSTLVGVVPELPKTVTMQYENGAEIEVDVIWDEVKAEDLLVEGDVTVQGTIAGVEEKAIATIKVIANKPNDEFNKPELNGKWSIEREVKDKWNLTENEGYLTIHGTAGYNDNKDRNDNDNIFLQERYSEDYTVTTKLNNKPTAGYQSAGLLSYVDKDNYVRVARKSVGSNILSFTYEVNGSAKHIEIPDPVSGQEIYLALEKVGNKYTSYYSVDGENWTAIVQNNVSTVEVNLDDSHKVGLYATNGTGPQYTAKFDNFRYLPYSPSTTVESIDEITVELNAGDKLPTALNGKLNLANGKTSNAIVELVNVDSNITNTPGTYEVTGNVLGTDMTVKVIIVVKETAVAVDKTKLEECIVMAKEIVKNDSDKYTNESIEALKAAIVKSDVVLADENATQEEVDSAKQNLEVVINGLEEKEETDEIVVQKVINLNATADKNEVNLTWDAPLSTVGVTGYVIYKDGKELVEVEAGTTEYTVTKLRSNTNYGFKVVTKYSNGEKSKPVSENVRTKK